MSRSRTARLVIWSCIALTVGCDGTEEPRDSAVPAADTSPADAAMDAPMVTGEIPCDVVTILDAACVRCHGDVPRFGAPMPLTSHAALVAPTPSDLSIPVYEMVGIRIHDPLQPMPPRMSGSLTDAEKAVLDAYVADMAPTRPPGSTCGD